MAGLKFEWDARKSLANKGKHGVSFEEAQSVFFDGQAVEFYDDRHSGEENRFFLLGRSYLLRVLLVVYCYRERDSVIRIISARRATKKEYLQYPDEP